MFYGDKKAVVYSIHPYEMSLYQTQIDQLERPEFYSVKLDERYNDWVKTSQEQLKFVWRTNELELFDKFAELYCTKTINLGTMLESEESFINEYRTNGLEKLLSIRDTTYAALPGNNPLG